MHPLAAVTSQLDQVAPRFEIDPSAICILDSPSAFYETLKVFQHFLTRYHFSDIRLGENQRSETANLSVNTIYREDRA